MLKVVTGILECIFSEVLKVNKSDFELFNNFETKNSLMRFLLFVSCFLSTAFLVNSQDNSYRVPIPVNWANNFEFIRNDFGKACLFLDQGDSYFIMLLDSNYNVLTEFSDRYYTNSPPTYLGCITNENCFELFFRRVEFDVLLVLVIDVKLKSLTRVKDFKITEYPGEKIFYTSSYVASNKKAIVSAISNSLVYKRHEIVEKIIFTGSNLSSNKMATLSFFQNRLIYKKHKPELITENKEIQLKPDDQNFIKDAALTYYKSHSDTLILLFEMEKVTEKNRRYRLFTIDLENQIYQSIEFGCGQTKKQPFLDARYFRNTVLLENCDKKLMMLDGLNGELIKEISLDYDSLFAKYYRDLFYFCYAQVFNEISDPVQYKYYDGTKMPGFNLKECRFDFFEDTTGLYLEIEWQGLLRSVYVSTIFYSRTYLPFDWEKKEILLKPPSKKFDDYIIYEIDKQLTAKTKTTGYFAGFGDKIMFGYLPKNSNELIIEAPDF
jgi:hypothetical protein